MRRTAGRGAATGNERKKGTGTRRETETFGPSILTPTTRSHTLQRSPDPGRHLHSPPSPQVGVEVQAGSMDQKRTEGVGKKRGALDRTTTITLTLTQITQTLTQTDKGGMTLLPRQLAPFTSPTPTLLRFNPPPLARPTPPHPESLSESLSESL